MSRSTVNFAASTAENFLPNTRRGNQYIATIQNLTTQTITITVTNQDMQLPNPTFDTPAQGALTILAGAIGVLTEPYNGWLISATSTSGTVEISEAG